AEECNVTQPALSRAIKLLEDEFGGALFHRERRHTHLTELGRMVETYLQGVFENSRQAKQIADEYVHLKKTPLRVGIMSTIAPDEVIELISSVRARHPGVELHLCDADAPTCVGGCLPEISKSQSTRCRRTYRTKRCIPWRFFASRW
ncbi:MAG: LysR family transcriptional regulator, partial [Mesorhizobium sp.]